MVKLQRRNFLKTASLAAAGIAGAGLSACHSKDNNQSPKVISSEKFEWRMITTWPPHFPILGELAERFAIMVDEMSAGRLKIQVYGGGELVPALEVFEAVSQGVAEMGHGAAYYWAGKSPAAQFFGSVPFGMNAQQVNAWLYYGGGLELWEEVYRPFNLIPMPCGNTGGQMGGWFNKEINSPDDLKGLKIRMPGLGGKVISKAGATSILSPGGEIYTNLERGVIDATEWIGPYHDYMMGFHQIAKYYYYPGWHEPGSVLELIVNSDRMQQLPPELQSIIRTAAKAINTMMLAEFETKNTEYYFKLINEAKTEIREFPDSVMNVFRKYTDEVIEEIVSSDILSKKVYDSYHDFRKNISNYNIISEKNYPVTVPANG
ncbi:MAG: TRAP transporter substrate-binding protein DctP [Ignavibacteriaceae bacterium]